MFLDFYNLREQPFGVTPDPRFLYFSMVHREALSSLAYGIETDQGFVALIAKPGMGKTTLLLRLHELLGDSAQTAFVFQTQCTSREFIRYIAIDLGITAPTSETGELIEQINQLLIREANQRRRVVLVVDEAQNLDDSVLETIRMLSNFQTTKAKLLQIVLAGQPQLAHKLMSPGLVQLRQRISILTRLCRLKPDEVAEYINYRLGVAGRTGPSLFSADAFSVINETSEGIPRNINTICFNALSLGYEKEQRVISSDIVREAVSDLDLYSFAGQKSPPEDAVGKEMEPIPVGDGKRITFSPSRNEVSPPRSFLPFQTSSRFLRWKVGAAVCILLVIVYLIASVPRLDQRLALPSTIPPPDYTMNTDLYSRESTMTFKVIVKPNDSVSKICYLYLGEYDSSVAKEVRRLNPGLTNINHVEIGQEILLPSLPGPATMGRPQTESQQK